MVLNRNKDFGKAKLTTKVEYKILETPSSLFILIPSLNVNPYHP